MYCTVHTDIIEKQSRVEYRLLTNLIMLLNTPSRRWQINLKLTAPAGQVKENNSRIAGEE
jgi:hypothetical protein